MSKASHTPAPWEWLDYPDGRKLLTGASGAVIHCPDSEMGVSQPDQVLIAAAPDLLGALKAMDALVENLWSAVDWGKTYNLDIQALHAAPLRAKKAIAAAEGSRVTETHPAVDP